MSSFNNIEDVWGFLDAIPKFQDSGVSATNFTFDNILKFLDKLGNPHLDLPAVHIAGTNGKGTTAYLLEKIYNDAGYKTGLFTSPHLIRYNERIRVGMEEISEDDLIHFFKLYGTFLAEIRLSYFEISTVIAFWYFKRQEVDIAIIETGLGGRLDSTNIIQPLLSIITNIGLDHQDILGETIEEIASEKAGIIKRDTPVILGNLQEEATRVCMQYAEELDAPVSNVKSLIPDWNKGVITLRNAGLSYQTLFKESINRWNVAMAWQAVQLLQEKFEVDDLSFKRSVESFSGAPGRFEKIHEEYEWYFSGSHNKEALISSLEAVRELKSLQNTVVVFSAMKDKVKEDFLDQFSDFGQRYFVEQKGERAAKYDDISREITVELMDETNAGNILNELKSELVIFMGSFYFYPIVKRWTTNVSQ